MSYPCLCLILVFCLFLVFVLSLSLPYHCLCLILVFCLFFCLCGCLRHCLGLISIVFVEDVVFRGCLRLCVVVLSLSLSMVLSFVSSVFVLSHCLCCLLSLLCLIFALPWSSFQWLDEAGLDLLEISGGNYERFCVCISPSPYVLILEPLSY